MDRGMIKSLIVLPGTVLIVIPAVILTVSQASRFSPKLAASNQVLFWSALLAASLGIGMSVWTVSLFVRFGAGTPAPWDPPKNLVVRGPYCHVRNPMITGVLFILMAESMIF